MYNIDKEKIKTIIENSVFSSDEEKNKQLRNLFLSFFSELCNYSQAVNENILSQSILKNYDAILPEICVALIDKDIVEKQSNTLGLVAMVDENDKIFIDDEYENIKKLIGDAEHKKKYEGQYIKQGQCHKFQYYLKFDRSFIEKQELLYEYALYYNLGNPILYSPYSHKSVTLIYDKEVSESHCELDFKFNENGINVINGIKNNLFWNIDIHNENRTYDAKVPYGNEVRYIFRFNKSKKGNYVLPLPLNNQTKVFNIEVLESMIEITTDHDMDEFAVLEPLECDETSPLIKTLKSNEKFFNNRRSYNEIINKRIISESDIEHSIATFRNNNGIKCCISEGGGQIVNRYTKKYRADRKSRKFFNTISREYVLFKAEEKKRFLTDYVNYVIEYLEFYYPEIEWVGEL